MTRKRAFYTRLIKAKPGWREHPLAHHPVFEEAYCLDGEFDYNFGTMTPGQYFFRPAGVRHCDFTAGEKDGCIWLLRCDGDLVDWYTENASVEMKGDPVNWGRRLSRHRSAGAHSAGSLAFDRTVEKPGLPIVRPMTGASR